MLSLQCYLFVLPSNNLLLLHRGRISALDQATVQRMSEMIDQQTEKRSR